MTALILPDPGTVQIPLAWVATVVLALVSALGIVFKLYLKSQKQLLAEKEEKYKVMAALKDKADKAKKRGETDRTDRRDTTDRLGS